MLRKSHFVAGIAIMALAGALGAAGAAQAQSTTPSATTPPPQPPASKPKSDATAVGELVITGSRIKQTKYTSPDPITQITAAQATLTGAVDTTQILQLSSVANNNVQINNNFTGFLVNGGPGVNTLSLRGLGAQRTLILIDGQRMGPAGVSGTVGAVDLNTIPESIIDHIDIDNTGASSIYGSDAVAGVVNIVTKKNLNGGNLKITVNPSQIYGGDSYDANGSWGKTFDRGYITAGFDVYTQEALRYGERSYLNCARDLANFPGNAGSADIIDPTTGKPKCWNAEGPDVLDYSDFIFYRAAPNGPSGFDYAPYDLPGFQAIGLTDQYGLGLTPAQIRSSLAQFPYNPPQYKDQTAISPVSRYSFTLNGGFDLTPHHQLYGSFLFNERDSSQMSAQQFFGISNPSSPQNTAGFGLPYPIIPQNEADSQRVDYYRAVVGVKGDVPSFGVLNNWTYDVYGQAAIDDGHYTMTYIPQDRANAVLWAANPAGCDPTAVSPFIGGLSMAQAEPGVSCVPFNLFDDVTNGGLTPQQRAFLYQQATGHTTYDHYYVEASATGDVFKLPAGMLKAAVGAEFRWESLDDTPPPDFVNQNVYGVSTVGVTKGSERAQEVYGELQIPVLRDLPAVQRFDITMSGRLSNYSNYGTNGTYKIGADWQITDWLTVRGTYGTAFRAPALYEQYLANQLGFLAETSIDPCINYGQPGVPANIRNNCASLGIPSNFGGGGQADAEIFQGGGQGLKPETSINDTIGIVFQPKWFGLNLKTAVTYYTFDIKNEIQNFGAANILYQCYNSPNFPNDSFCKLFTRQPYDSANPNTSGSILTVNDDFVNVAEEIDQGLDWETTYIVDLPRDFKLTVEANLAWTFYTNTKLLGGSTNNFLGQVGQPAFNGNIDFKLDHGEWTFNYYLYAIGTSSDNDFVPSCTSDYDGTGQAACFNHTVPFYTNSAISVQRRFDNFTLTAGIKNLYDTPPPYYSTSGFQYRLGVVPLTSQYDLIGRSFFLTLEKKF